MLPLPYHVRQTDRQNTLNCSALAAVNKPPIQFTHGHLLPSFHNPWSFPSPCEQG